MDIFGNLVVTNGVLILLAIKLFSISKQVEASKQVLDRLTALKEKDEEKLNELSKNLQDITWELKNR